MPTLELEALVRERLLSLSLSRKVVLLTGADFWSTRGDAALGLQPLHLSDGPGGVRGMRWDEREPSVGLPSPAAVAATWDPEGTGFAHGRALASEARRKDVHVVLAPAVNLQRSAFGGRGFEGFGEDPVLVARFGAAVVRGIQSLGVAACVKHYVGNDVEVDRFTADVRVDERVLREALLLPFERAIAAGAWSVMSAYSGVNGTTMTESPLLIDPLRSAWGFDGLVISDWGAVRSTTSAAAGQDLTMPGPVGPWGEQLIAAVQAGTVPEERIDDMVVALCRLAARVGRLDLGDRVAGPPARDASARNASIRGALPPGVAGDHIRDTASSESTIAYARTTAAAGMVLLRNEGGALPLGAGIRRVAVIGEHAHRPRTQGGGSATVVHARRPTPAEALREAMPGVQVTAVPGVRLNEGLEPLDEGRMRMPDSDEPGLLLQFLDAEGRLVLEERRRSAALVWLGDAPVHRARRLRVCTRYRAERAGRTAVGTAADGRVRLSVDRRLVLDAHLEHRTADPATFVDQPWQSVAVELAEESLIEVEHTLPQHEGPFAGVLFLTLGLEPSRRDDESAIAEAAACAEAADAAIVVVGTTEQDESEGFDRTSLALPGRQDDLIRAVAARSALTIVVLVSGAPVLTPWRGDVSAILLAHFAGQELGGALADVLSGSSEPGGRLAQTWPAAEQDALRVVPELNPSTGASVLSDPDGSDLGYRRWLRHGLAPAFGFGHGLGYTIWEPHSVRFGVEPAQECVAVNLTVSLRNVGERSGKHVVQVYAVDEETADAHPLVRLAGSGIVRAPAGAIGSARIEVDPAVLRRWIPGIGWRWRSGTLTLGIGSSLADRWWTLDVELP